jgi:polysaccharide deacetylase 2 family uncharacterized protein YibQ
MEMTDDDWNAPLGQLPVRKCPSQCKMSHIGMALGGLGLLGAFAPFFSWPGGLAPAEHRAGIEFHSPPTDLHKTVRQGSPASPRRFSSKTSVPLGNAPVPSPSFSSTSFPGTGATVQTAGLGPEAIERRSGVKVIRAGGGGPPGALIIDVATALNTRLAGASDPRLIESTRYGLVPKIGADGTRPAEIYARAIAPLPGLPRIALLVEGLGLSPRATEAAIAGLPVAVTLGFTPYGTDLARQTARAREAGHELLLEIPMETFDFPQDNPGLSTLVTQAAKASDSDKLAWLMSRFTGYAGVANLLGGKFTADEKALTPILHEIAARGLFYLDDGSSARSLAMTLAPVQTLTAARADVILDLTARPEVIEAALGRLEAIARSKGLAIGVASLPAASIEIIGRFARNLESRGIALVPLSAAMPRIPSLDRRLADHHL